MIGLIISKYRSKIVISFTILMICLGIYVFNKGQPFSYWSNTNLPDDCEDVISELSTGDTGIIWGGRNLIDAGDKVFNTLVSRDNDSRRYISVENRDYFYRMLEDNDYIYRGLVKSPIVTGLVVKKGLAKKVMFDNRFYVNTDGLFLWMIFFLSDKSVFISAPTVNYRWVDNSERAKPAQQGILFIEMKGILKR